MYALSKQITILSSHNLDLHFHRFYTRRTDVVWFNEIGV